MSILSEIFFLLQEISRRCFTELLRPIEISSLTSDMCESLDTDIFVSLLNSVSSFTLLFFCSKITAQTIFFYLYTQQYSHFP
mmetsp:Transcript_13463/g.6623  ORF Transcript_13463/g.6623 Transcript_13463/m.6623 type:complete len:82 (+) Transcript_13463:386-631(+)